MKQEFDRRSQMIKGVLDLCVMSVLAENPTYGYGLIAALEERGFELIAEGSVYPLLARLTKSGLVHSYSQPSPAGPKRKYYELTDAGREALAVGTGDWLSFSSQVTQLLAADSKEGSRAAQEV